MHCFHFVKIRSWSKVLQTNNMLSFLSCKKVVCVTDKNTQQLNEMIDNTYTNSYAWHECKFISNQIYASINKQANIHCSMCHTTKQTTEQKQQQTHDEMIAANDIVAEISFSFASFALPSPPPRLFTCINWMYVYSSCSNVFQWVCLYACIWTIVRYLNILHLSERII